MGVSTVVAADNNTAIKGDIVSDTSQITSTDVIVTDYGKNTDTTDNIESNTNNLKNNNKTLKTSSKTVEVTNYNELSTAINNAVNDADNDEYIIELQEGTYLLNGYATFYFGQYSRNIIINGNNQTLNGSGYDPRITLNNNCNITFNNMNIVLKIINNGNLSLNNTFLNSSIENSGNLTIDDNTKYGENTFISGNGKLTMNDMSNILPHLLTFNGEYTIENYTANKVVQNYGNITFINSCFSSTLTNNGNMTLKNCTINSTLNCNYESVTIISDDTIFSNNSIISNYNNRDTVIINDTNRIAHLLMYFTDSYTFNNLNFSSFRHNVGANTTFNGCNIYYITNSEEGNLTINNSNITNSLSNYVTCNCIINNSNMNTSISNSGNLTIINSTLNSTLLNTGIVYISDDTIIGSNFKLSGDGEVIINNTNEIFNYLSTLNGNSNVSDINITTSKTNNGNLITNNCIITGNIENNANFTAYNSTLNCTITNKGNLTISDDTILGENLLITGSGQIIINDTDRIVPYLNSYNGTYTINNTTITNSKVNYGNLTIENSIINNTINNIGNLSITNSNINGSITNIGNLNITNTTVNQQITNRNELIITNSSINNIIQNNNNLTIKNSIVNSTIINYGNITIEDDVIFTENSEIISNGRIIINDIERILLYLSSYNGTYTINNTTITNSKVNYGNLTIENSIINNTINNIGNLSITNSNINGSITNNANLNLTNSTINSTIANTGNLTISDDVIFTENASISGNGEIIINDFNRIIPYLTILNGDYTFTNTTILSKTNTGNLTLIDCNITGKISNRGNLTLINCQGSNVKFSIGNSISDGGTILFNQANTIIINSTFENNTLCNSSNFQNYVCGGVIFNRGNLSIFNSSFINNEAFTGGAICSYNAQKLKIEGSTFENNIAIDRSNYDGSMFIQGGAIYSDNTPTIEVNNCIFKNNEVNYNVANRNGGNGGAIALRQSSITVVNSTFDNNQAKINNQYTSGGADGGAIYQLSGNYLNITYSKFYNNKVSSTSTWSSKTGQGGAISHNSINASITNNIFTNNSANSPIGVTMTQYDIISEYNGCGGSILSTTQDTLIITNNTIENSVSENEAGALAAFILNGTANIHDNTFNNITSPHETILINSANDTTISLENNTYENCSIEFNSLNITLSETNDNTTIEITGNIELKHPDYYDSNLLNKTKYQFHINGEPVLKDTLDINLTVENNNLIIYARPTITNKITNIIILKSSTENEINITPENYDNYIIIGQLIGINPNSTINFIGNFINKEEISISTENITIDGKDATFTNTSIILDADNIILKNMNINNTDTSEYAIENYGNNNIITNNTITHYNNDGKTARITNKNSNVTISNNILNVYGPAYAITYEDGANTANTQAILSIGGQNNHIEYNNITVKNSTDSELSAFGTIEAITAPSGINNSISYNNIYCTGSRFNYGINTLDNVMKNQITYNNITVTGYRYTDGIQVGNGATDNTITNNNINLTCLNTTPVDEAALSYGIIVTSQGGQNSDNNTIKENNITINGVVNYGMEIYTATNTQITENNIKLTGVKSMGIGYAHSPNSTVTKNIIIINDNSSQPLNSETEEIQPQSVGIRIQQDSENVTIENNTIKTNDSQKTDKTIDTTSQKTIIKNNQLENSDQIGDSTIVTTVADTIIQANTGILNSSTENNTNNSDNNTNNNSTQSEQSVVIITPENMDILVDDWGMYDKFQDNTTYLFQGNFEDIDIYTMYKNNIILDGTNATFNNFYISITGNNTIIQNMNITSSNIFHEVIFAGGTNNKIINNILIINNTQAVTTYPYTTNTRTILVSHANNILIENNTIQTYGPATEPNLYIEWMTVNKTANTQAILAVDSQNTIINQNNITVTNSTTPTPNSTLEAITLLNTNNTQITNNQINLTEPDVNTPINTTETSQNTTTENNTIILPTPKENVLKVDITTYTLGQYATIKASIYYGDDVNTTINKGKIIFKVNGKTLKDANGKVIYAKVVNGTATIENYTVPDTWKEGTTIEAVYSGSTQLEKLNSEKTNITVTPKELTVTTNDITAIAGTTTTLTATLNDSTINTGKIVFKINGKTVKDANGKIIYAKVVNGTVSINYTIPESYKAGNYTLTATYIGTEYDRLTSNSTITIVKD